MAVAMGVTVVGAIAFPSPETLLINLVVALTLCLNFWIFAELGIAWSRCFNQIQTGIRLAGLFVGALGVGWAMGLIFD